MPDFLLFTHFAPIAAFGQIAVGEVRGTWDRPGKSAILGLLAGGLGLARDDAAGQAALAEAYGYAVRTDAPGRPLSDYQTIKPVPQSIVKSHGPIRNRKHGLESVIDGAKKGRSAKVAKDLINGMQSWRAYRTDGLFTVALWLAQPEPPRWSLDDLAVALRHPHYQPYAGRKACPFALPLAPELVRAETLAAAFAARKPWPADLPLDTYDRGDEPARRLNGHGAGWSRDIAYDAAAPPALTEGLRQSLIRQRRDRVAERPRWQFAWRDEAIATLPPAEEAET